MIFRKKAEVVDPYSMERCTSCNNILKRKFKEGDYIFKTTKKCVSCSNGQMMIAKIFGEVVK